VVCAGGKGTLDGITDIASVAGLLKLYLRELPEPLLVFRFYSTFVKIASTCSHITRTRACGSKGGCEPLQRQQR
jgi:hypothetical protein